MAQNSGSKALISCGILKAEVEAALAAERVRVPTFYLAPAPCINPAALERQLTHALQRASAVAEETVVLIGLCHRDIDAILGAYGARRMAINDCFDALLGPRRKELDREANTFYTLPAWLRHWRRALVKKWGWEDVDARQNFGLYKRILLVDAGVESFSDEEVLELFDFTGIPVEIMQVELTELRQLLRRSLGGTLTAERKADVETPHRGVSLCPYMDIFNSEGSRRRLTEASLPNGASIIITHPWSVKIGTTREVAMKVKVKFFAAFREIMGQREMEIDVPNDTSVGMLLETLVEQNPRLTEISRACRLVVDQEFVDANAPLKEGNEVVFVPPVAGGGRFEITEEALTVEDLVREVRDDGAGAVVTFVGVVRNNSKGKRVLYLEYEAYKQMAEKKLAEIGEEIRAKWGLDRLAIRHRVGRLEIGETAVVIALASPHRHEGFEACQYAIDRLKQIVPIWKKEVWEDGEVWVGLQE